MRWVVLAGVDEPFYARFRPCKKPARDSPRHVVLGIKDRIQLDWFTGDDGARLNSRYEAPTLWDAFVGVMHRDGIAVPKGWLVPPKDSEVLNDDMTPEISKEDVERIIMQAVDEANLVRAGIRLIVDGQPIPGARVN